MARPQSAFGDSASKGRHQRAAEAGSAVALHHAWAPSWPLLAGVFAFLYLFGNWRYLLRDGDTLWHAAAGRWMLEHGMVVTADPFSSTMRGAPWMAHEWASQIAIALAQRAGGWTCVVALCAAAFALAIAMLTRALLRWLEPIHALLFALLAVFMSAGHALARPHLLAMPVLLAWTIELVRSRDEGRTPRLRFLPLMTLWANLHGGFTLGLALAGAFAIEAALQARTDRAALRAALTSWGLFLALAAVAALATPQGIRGLWLSWQVLMQYTYALDVIDEWRSPDFHIFQPLELWLLGGLAVVLYQGLHLPPLRLVLMVGLMHLALKHARYIELVGLIAPLVVAAPFAAQWRERQRGKPQSRPLDALFTRLVAPAGAAALTASLLAAATVTAWTARTRPLDFSQNVAPTDAVAAARRAGVSSGPVLNGYTWGGWLAWAGIPSFIDGRSEMYGDDFLRRYGEALGLSKPGAFEALVDSHHVTWTLLPHGTPAIALLDHLPGWRRIYTDGTAVVHARVRASESEGPR